jgi:hypothetical protein
MGQRHSRVRSNLRHVRFVDVLDPPPERGACMAQEEGAVA